MSVNLLFRQDSKKKEKYENDIKNGERKGGDGRKLGKNLKGTDTKNNGSVRGVVPELGVVGCCYSNLYLGRFEVG